MLIPLISAVQSTPVVLAKIAPTTNPKNRFVVCTLYNIPQTESIIGAIAAYLASTQQLVSPGTYYQTLVSFLPTAAGELLALIRQACDSAMREETGATRATRGSGVSPRIAAIIQLGEDTDTIAAILGGIMGAAVGKTGIPQQWLKDLWPCPRSVNWIEALGQRLMVWSNLLYPCQFMLSLLAIFFS